MRHRARIRDLEKLLYEERERVGKLEETLAEKNRTSAARDGKSVGGNEGTIVLFVARQQERCIKCLAIWDV